MSRSLLSLLALVACANDTEFVQQRRVLDSFPYVDCGVIAPGDRQVCTVPLFSEGDGDVTIFDVRSADVSVPTGGALDVGAFIVAPGDWQDPACGEGDCRTLAGYHDDSDEDTHALVVTFAPQVEGYYQAELTVWSNDTVSTSSEPLPDDPNVEKAVWKVQLRGLARPACGRVYPEYIDFGQQKGVGGEFADSVRIDNCGIVTLVIGGYQEQGTGAEEMGVRTSFPLYALPSLYEDVVFNWVVGPETNLEPTPVQATMTFSSNAEALDASVVTLLGNDCTQSVDKTWDADSDGWFSCGGDCDDLDATVNPSQTERVGNGQDDDCDDVVDETANPVGSDDDGDGFSEQGGDCDDADDAVHPSANESINQRDDDCDGYVDNWTERYDDDGDGFSERAGDCDDGDRLIAPGIAESQNGIDDDCDGIVDEGSLIFDDDQDGFVEQPSDASPVDCDDGDPWVYVGAFEYCDDYDNDCDGKVDEGADDAEGGACAFLPERRDLGPTEGEAAAEGGGCAAVPGSAGALTAILAGLAGFARRRGERGRNAVVAPSRGG